jgi:hypothetical protein
MIKNIKLLWVLIIILLQAAVLHADDLRVMVGMAQGEAADKELSRKVTILCSEAVIRSKGFRYISPTETVRIMTGNKKIVVDKVLDLEKEYSDKNEQYLQEMSEPYKNNSWDNIFRMLEGTDILVGGTVHRAGPLVRVELHMNNGRNQKQYDVTIECEESRLDAEIPKKVMDLLKKIAKSSKIYADNLKDAKDSIVTYAVKAMDNTDIMIEMDYTGDRPDPKAQNVKILPPDAINKNSATTYKVKSEEGSIIDIEFAFKRGNLDFVRVNTPIPDPSKKTKQAETLTVKSRAGYELKFEFLWDKGEMQSAKLYPVLNPFGDYEE